MELKAFDINDWFLFNVKHCHTLATKSKMTLLMNKKLCYKYMISYFDSGSIALCNNQVLNNVIHKGRVLKNHVQEIIG